MLYRHTSAYHLTHVVTVATPQLQRKLEFIAYFSNHRIEAFLRRMVMSLISTDIAIAFKNIRGIKCRFSLLTI